MSKPIAIIFPGQGSQSLGMLGELAVAWPLVGETFAEASDTLGMDLWQVVSQGPRELLDRTDITQPAMLAAGVAVWRVWNQAGGPAPAWMAGHSLGEFTALVCAGSLGFADAIALVAQRGRFMQEAVPAGAGAMAAVLGLADDQVVAVCAQAAQGGILEPVNFNSPGQVVIAGEAAAVERGIAAAKAAGAKRAILLPVSVPSHCALMRPAAERLAVTLAAITLEAPRIPVLHNVTVDAVADPVAIRERLVRQLYSPVRWVETVRCLADQGVGLLLEAGPGKVLTGLTKRIDDRLEALAVLDPKGLALALEATQHA
ncbi:MAG: ACP S-malonyltransferase [Chromatiaceae bacterium]|jgi:[acyl-carrier-protein] S-malonyltransferase|nr:ACP S-malonyltransferase [Chromatiaceae bacterium]MBP6807855.1 ACP S-malonyltransferase [Chromatiaceae bacterium]